MLRRLGNKTRLLPKLLALFPEQITTFIDMFMGSGAVTFAMVDRAKYIIANDKDEEVFNLFMVLKEHKQELEDAIRMMPIHDKLFQYWKNQQEHDCVWRATRFLMLSNFGYMGKPNTLHFQVSVDNKSNLLKNLYKFSDNKIRFMCCDFREVLKKLTYRDDIEKEKTFAYADPPYLGTDNNYQSSFTEDDTRDLFSILTGSGLRFAVSEFANPIVIALAEEHGLRVHDLGERRNLKNRKREILITNYHPERQQVTVFDVLNQQAGQHNKRLQLTRRDAGQNCTYTTSFGGRVPSGN